MQSGSQTFSCPTFSIVGSRTNTAVECVHFLRTSSALLVDGVLAVISAQGSWKSGLSTSINLFKQQQVSEEMPAMTFGYQELLGRRLWKNRCVEGISGPGEQLSTDNLQCRPIPEPLDNMLDNNFGEM